MPSTNATWGSSTDDYCALGKKGMAEEAWHCPWPKTPPFCDSTWQERIGEGTVTSAKIFYLVVFSAFFIIHVRYFTWANLRLKLRKKGFFERTANEWMNIYCLSGVTLRLVQAIFDYAAVYGVLPLMYLNFVTEVYVGLLASSIFTIVWGWYKVLLPSQNRAAKAAKADLLHNIFRITCIASTMIGGVLGTMLLPEKYAGTGVYLGNVHAVLRTVIFILLVILTTYTWTLGKSIQTELDRGAAGAKVAPTPAEGDKKEPKKKKTDAEKIIVMIYKIVAVVVVMCLYLVYDIVTAINVVRHIVPPFCEGKNAFIRLISLMQILLCLCITYVFPVKKPDVKGRTGMMGTTKVTTTGSTEVEASS
ncbi:hypothetical protein TrVE_jg2923 [Triparma verrucosa]|uniref:Uncharacterized protein n=1 Tax=Triparma verrucosa TaxID=1606542 RepID=A0A9W7FCN3_9STRA|nr:hypothetical protein TrVE_jg2923 [Triparma verrucosa]